MKYFFLFVLAGAIGCVTGSFSRKAPATYEGKTNSKIVKLPREQLWTKLIPAIGKTFFTINNLDKSSGLVNLTFSANPEKYVDCGWFNSTVENARGSRSYIVNFSSPQTQYEVFENGMLIQIERKLALEGKINLIVEKLSASSTKITVNTRYILTRTATATGGLDGNYRVMQRTQVDTATLDFDTKGSFGGDSACVVTGELEKEILNLVP